MNSLRLHANAVVVPTPEQRASAPWAANVPAPGTGPTAPPAGGAPAPAHARVVLVVPSFPKLSETFIVNKFLGLLERGWDVHVFCEVSEPGDWEKFPRLQARTGARARVHAAWPVQSRGRAALLAPVAAAAALARAPGAALRLLRTTGWKRLYLDGPLLALRPALIHFEFGPLARDRMHVRALLGCRVVASFRGYDLNFAGLENPDYYAPVWREADGLHLLGEDLWRRALRRGCPPTKRRALIPPAIDAGYFNPGERRHTETAGSAARPLRILSVGRLEWKKGYEFALDAVRRLQGAGVVCEYEIIGAGGYLEAVAFARHQLGLDDCVRLAGALSPAEVRARMGQADVFLHAAVSEGFCNAVLEAQAMMLPVVCSDADGLSENVVHGETGFVTPRRDPAALAEKLAELARQPALRQRFGDAGHRRVATQFRLEDQIAAFDRLYREVLALPFSPPASAA